MIEPSIEELRRRVNETPPGVAIDRLRAIGIIDDKGQVTGKVIPWEADRAITQIEPSTENGKVATLTCLLPVFGIAGTATVEIRRENLVKDLIQGKKVIAAIWDDRLKMWRQGLDVRLSPTGYIRTDESESAEDYIDLLTVRPSNVHG